MWPALGAVPVIYWSAEKSREISEQSTSRSDVLIIVIGDVT
jgi:hypothetical protein